MAAQNYAVRYQPVIDEVFRLKSVTGDIVNNGIRLDFNGVNSVSIYTVATPTEGNYVRTGTNRFGSLAELSTGKETFVLSQDKSFTYTIDRGNLEDSMMVQEAGSTLRRTIEVVCVPNTDQYRLTTLQAYAVANSQSATTALSTSNAYIKVLDGRKALVNASVPVDDLVMFATASSHALFLQDTTNFLKPSDLAQETMIKGQVGKIAGIRVIEVPDSYLPANTAFIIVAKDVLVAPHKFDTFRILKEVQGIDGWVVEGRRYYDAFIPTNRGKALWVHMNA